MHQEKLRQRIHYLIEHGGLYPEHERDRLQRALPWMVGAVLICVLVELILLLR